MCWIRVAPPGTGCAGGWVPQRPDLQRCDPGKRGGHWRGWQPSITALGWSVLSGVPLSTDHFMLLEIQYTLIFSLSSQHFTTGPTNVPDFTLRRNRLWLLYKILQSMVTVTALLIKRTCRGSLCEHRDDQLQNDKRKSAVDYKSTPSGKDVGLLDFKRTTSTRIFEEERLSVHVDAFFQLHVMNLSIYTYQDFARTHAHRAATGAAEDKSTWVNYTSTSVEHLAWTVFDLPAYSRLYW